METQRLRNWPRIGIFLLLALGAAVLWALVMGWAVSLGAVRRAQVYENLEIDLKGEPRIASQLQWPTWQKLATRTLDGKPASESPVLHAAGFYHPPSKRVWGEGPPNWNYDRLVTLEGGRNDVNSPSVWFLIVDASEAGRGYLAGYDKLSKMNVGYIGRRGLVRAVPPESDQFVVGRIAGRTTEVVLARESGAQPEHYFYLFDEDRVVEVRLRQPLVRTIATLPSAYAMGTVIVPSGDAEDAVEELASREPKPRNGFVDSRVVVATDAGASMIEPTTGDRVEFELPAALLEAPAFTLFVVSSDSAILSYNPEPMNPFINRLLWLRPDGPPIREETVELAGYEPSNNRLEAAVASAIVPVPALMGAAAFALIPYGMVSSGQASSFADGLQKTLSDFWPGGLGLAVVSAALALSVLRKERNDCRPHPGWMAGFVFALGVPAFLAYLANRRPEPTGACPACGRVVPKARTACARCGGDFPAPALKGTEVFA
jgi:hypothetical protein